MTHYSLKPGPMSLVRMSICRVYDSFKNCWKRIEACSFCVDLDGQIIILASKHGWTWTPKISSCKTSTIGNLGRQTSRRLESWLAKCLPGSFLSAPASATGKDRKKPESKKGTHARPSLPPLGDLDSGRAPTPPPSLENGSQYGRKDLRFFRPDDALFASQCRPPALPKRREPQLGPPLKHLTQPSESYMTL